MLFYYNIYFLLIFFKIKKNFILICYFDLLFWYIYFFQNKLKITIYKIKIIFFNYFLLLFLLLLFILTHFNFKSKVNIYRRYKNKFKKNSIYNIKIGSKYINLQLEKIWIRLAVAQFKFDRWWPLQEKLHCRVLRILPIRASDSSVWQTWNRYLKFCHSIENRIN